MTGCYNDIALCMRITLFNRRRTSSGPTPCTAQPGALLRAQLEVTPCGAWHGLRGPCHSVPSCSLLPTPLHSFPGRTPTRSPNPSRRLWLPPQKQGRKRHAEGAGVRALGPCAGHGSPRRSSLNPCTCLPYLHPRAPLLQRRGQRGLRRGGSYRVGGIRGAAKPMRSSGGGGAAGLWGKCPCTSCMAGRAGAAPEVMGRAERVLV